MELNDRLFDYLKSKLPSFSKTTKRGQALFTCPNVQYHKYNKDSKEPTATIIPGSDKIQCLQCSWKGTFYDVVRLLEEDKRGFSDAQVMEYLINSLEMDVYSELETYKKYEWSLVPLAKNSKAPIEEGWTGKTHYEKVDWIKWLNNGLNIGVQTGKVSKITVIDVDIKQTPTPEAEEVHKLLADTETLKQNSPHGTHYVFQYDEELPQTVDIGGLKIDIRNDGGQIVIQPSKVNNLGYNWKNLGNEITLIPENVKNKLLEYLKLGKSKKIILSQEVSKEAETVIKMPEGGRNNLLTSIGGLLIHKLSPEHSQFVLEIINNKFMNPPLPKFEIENMLGSLEGYKTTTANTQELVIYEYLKLMQNDVNARDIMDNTKLSRAIVDKYLSQFVRDGKAIRLARGRYKFREKVEWSDKFNSTHNHYPYKIPYFDDITFFDQGDIVLIGGKTSQGKTTMALNLIKQVADQGVKPFYIYSESGSRHQKIAAKLGLAEGSFYHSFHANPLSIEIEANSFTVLDWLLISEKENTDTVFKFFAEEMQRKGGILVILMQLKDNYDWFAPNLVTQFPAVAARYIFDSEDGLTGHFQVDKLRDPKGNYRNYAIPCEYSTETKLLTAKSLL